MYSTFRERDYIEWLSQYIPNDSYYTKLIDEMFYSEFSYINAMDSSRAEDGLSLRYRYELEKGYPEGTIVSYFDRKPCSILEMIVGLAIRAEETFGATNIFGSYASHLIGNMLYNMGLSSQTDDNYDPIVVDDILTSFVYRQYSRNGEGGLFVINDPSLDLRRMDIWKQLNWYLLNHQEGIY